MNDAPYRLYRYFDSKRRLLYIGISGDLARRDRTHISRSKWMQFTARSTVEQRKTLEDVKRAEREAIETERPIFNKLHNNTPEVRKRLRAYLAKAGRLDLLPPEPEVPAAARPAGLRMVLGATHPVLVGGGGTLYEWRDMFRKPQR